MSVFLVFAFFVSIILCVILWRHRLRAKREAFIRSFAFPRGLYAQLGKLHPQLEGKDLALVNHGLRQFFLAYLKSDFKFVAMPSQVADDLWHEFILHTRSYQQFCEQAFGRFLHHTPAAVLTNNQQVNTGLRRCWRFACEEENIAPANPVRLPLLFALDSKLAIVGGFMYTTDCTRLRSQNMQDSGGYASAGYCGTDFSSSGFDGGTTGLSDGDSGGGDGGSGSDSGCGGGGCGGGGD